MAKFPEEQRTFETRVAFIKSIFADKYNKEQIMQKCIQYKLSKSFEQYEADLTTAGYIVNRLTPLTAIKQISKE